MINDFEKYRETKSFLTRAQGHLNDSFTWMSDSPEFKDYAPTDLQKKVNEFLAYLKSYDVEKLRPKAIVTAGEFFNAEELKESIQEITGYVWKRRKLYKEEIEELGFTPEGIIRNSGINPSSVNVIEFCRNSKSRGELWLLNLVLMPGCAFITWDSGRAAGSTNIHHSIEELMEEFSKV